MVFSIQGSRPIWQQLTEQLARRIITGAYPLGARFPAVRELAAEAGVNGGYRRGRAVVDCVAERDHRCRSEGQELPDRTFEEAGRLAAYYSKGRDAEKVEIDYIQKKQVKKPAGAKPGFVVYYTNYSLMIDSDISGIEKISD